MDVTAVPMDKYKSCLVGLLKSQITFKNMHTYFRGMNSKPN